MSALAVSTSRSSHISTTICSYKSYIASLDNRRPAVDVSTASHPIHQTSAMQHGLTISRAIGGDYDLLRVVVYAVCLTAVCDVVSELVDVVDRGEADLTLLLQCAQRGVQVVLLHELQHQTDDAVPEAYKERRSRHERQNSDSSSQQLFSREVQDGHTY